MAETTKKPNTIKSIGKKVANNGNANDYVYIPIGADSDNVDRPDGSTVEESLSEIEIEKVEIIPVETLPTSEIQVYPFIYALVKANESKGIFYEYRDGKWIKYGNGANGIWVGTKEECAKEFDNIETGTIVIIVKKGEESGDTHTHDYVEYVTKAPTYSEPGIKTCKCFLCGESYTEEIPALIDSVKPAGVIRIGNNEYATWKDTVSFDTYYKDNQTVTIEASDNETGIKEIAYHLANTAVSDSNIGTVTWTPYTDPFTIEPNNNYIIYVRITDNSDNVTYICSDGIVMDNIPPVFEGLEDGGTYPTGTVLTVEDGATLTVDGVAVELVNNTYTFTEPKDNIQLSLTDRAGNSSNITLIIEHTCHFVDGVCPDCGKSEYEEIELTQNNLYMTGLTTAAEDYNTPTGEINIPGTFEYNNKKYKVTSINCSNVWEPYLNVTSLILPSTITNINSIGGFRTCEYVTIPESVTKTKNNPVNYFDNLKILYWNSEYTNNMELSWKTNFDTNIESTTYKLVLGENITTIPYIFNYKENSTAGSDYTKIREIEIKNSNAVIRENTFMDLYDLEKINFPENLKNIDSWTFANCSKLSDINLDGIEFIGEMAFQNTGFTSLSFPDTLKKIGGNGTFSNCKKLVNVNLNKIEKLGYSTFNNCPNLSNITWSDNITVLDSGTFSNCTSLTVTIPNNVYRIGDNAFYNVPHIYYNGTATGSPWGAKAIN